MKFKNISNKTKHIKVDGTWLTVKPKDIFEVNHTLGRLHLDPELSKVGVNKDTLKSEPAKKSAIKSEPKKDVLDVSGLDNKSKARVKDLKEDLADDGKRNMSHKKLKNKSIKT